MPPRFHPLFIGWFFLSITLCARVFGGFTYERLATFQPPPSYCVQLTMGSDGNAYTVSDYGLANQRILRIDADGRVETVVMFGLDTELSSVKPWLVLGPDGSLYGAASKALPQHPIIYRLTPSGQIEELGDGDFFAPPVLGGDGAFYGYDNAGNGVRRFRAGGVFETVPGTEGLKPPNYFANAPVVGPDGGLYFTSTAKLWKIGNDGVLSEFARFDDETMTTLGTGLDSFLAKGKSGAIYGRTHFGGPENRGVIFRITPGGVIETVALFGSEPGRIDNRQSSSDSFNLAEGVGGALYFVVDPDPYSSGRVIGIRPDGTATEIGILPKSRVGFYEVVSGVTGPDGQAYAFITSSIEGNGTKSMVFKLSIESGCTIIGEAEFPDEQDRYAGPAVLGPDGGLWAIFYTLNGWPRNSHSRLVRLRSDATFESRPLYPSDLLPGRNPRYLRALPGGAIVGATEGLYSASTHFRISPDGSVECRQISLEAASAPREFDDGSLVGLEYHPGIPSLIFQLKPDGSENVIRFNQSGSNLKGDRPDGELVKGSDGSWYGLTRGGGAGPGSAGTIYRVSPSFQVETVYEFDASGSSSLPSYPIGSFIDGGDGALYAIVIRGCAKGVGGLIRYEPGGEMKLVASFSHMIANPSVVPSPAVPQLKLGNGGWFYGVTSFDSQDPANGFIYRVNKKGKFEVLGRFTGLAGALPGSIPPSSLTLAAGGALYGVTLSGGANDAGTVFRVTPTGDVQHVASFTGTGGALPGSKPIAALVRRGNVLYGACSTGGAFDSGTIFRIDQSGRVAIVHTLTGLGGASPGYGPNCLTVGADGHLYGTGGANNQDFQINPANIHGTIFRLKFAPADGLVDDILEVPVNHADLLANEGFDSSTQSPRIASITQPAHGRVTLHADGTVSYQPKGPFTAEDQFTYTVKDGPTVLGTATVRVGDTRPPEILIAPTQWSFAAGADGTAVIPDFSGEVPVRDVSTPIVAVQTPPPGSALAIGEHTISFTFTDAAGNSSNIVFPFTVFDATQPVFTTKPADRTIYRVAGEPAPLCPDLRSEATATDNAPVLILAQEPAPGTPLPDGYTNVVISAYDGPNVGVCHVSIRVIPPARAIGTTGDLVPGFEVEHRYVSFGLPAIAADGTVAFKATIQPVSGAVRTAVFRGVPGSSSPVPVAYTGGSESFTQFGEPLVNSAGTVLFTAISKSTAGRKLKGVWAAKIGAPPELLAQSGSPLPVPGSTEIIRDFKDVSLLDSGTMIVQATVAKGPTSPPVRTLWLIEDGTWRLLLRTGESLTLDGRPSAVADFGFGKLVPRVGGQTRSFNASGTLALRLIMTNQRSAIVRVAISGGDVVVEPLVDSFNANWLSLGIPALNDEGDIVFRGIQKIFGGRVLQVIGRIAAGGNTLELIDVRTLHPTYPINFIKYCDPIVTSAGDVAIPLEPAGTELRLIDLA